MQRQRFLPVVLAGRSILLREGLARILRAAHFRILASVSSADDFPLGKPTPHPPLLLIVHTGDTFDSALEQIKAFRSRHANGRIAVVADHYRQNDLSSAFRAGANGYFVNVITCDRFVKSLELVMLGETIFPPAFLSCVLDPVTQPADAPDKESGRDQTAEPILVAADDPTPPLLSPREKLILNCLIEGDSNKCIARKMDIAEATVKVHVKAILRKIRVQNRTQAAIWGINNGPQTQLENGHYRLAISNAGGTLVKHAGQIGPPAPASIEAARMQRMSRRSRRLSGTARPGKEP